MSSTPARETTRLRYPGGPAGTITIQPHGEELIRGRPARWVRHDPRPCLMPPTGPYRPILAVQQREASE